ncbi:MAG: YbaK/EbsC family protein [Candidatus Heimdallarchaeota archaeon]
MNLKTEKYLSSKHNRNVNDNVQSYDFSILSDLGKHEFVICTKCEYKATRDVAVVHKSASDVESEADLSEVHTPESKTIAQLAQLLGIAESKCAKAVFYSYSNQNGSKLVLVIIRGDMEVNEFKVKQLLNVGILKVATDIEIEKVGGVPGFASAISINREQCTVIVDELIPKSKNLVAGANKVDYHLLNTNYDRDYNADIVSDVALATESGNCSNCQASLEIKLGIPICQLTVDRENKSVAYLDDKGKPSIGSVINFEFDLTRILGALSLDFDKFGVKFPIQISPFQIVLITIGSEPEVMQLGDKLHEELNWHFDVLYDNRDVKLGVKLNDTDLRSIPFRLIISKRSIEDNEIEFSKRGSRDKGYFKLEKVLAELEQIKEVLMYKAL